MSTVLIEKEIRPGARKHDDEIRELLQFSGCATYWQLADALRLRGGTIYDIIGRMVRERAVEVVNLEERGFVSRGVIVPFGMAKRWNTCALQLLDSRIQLNELLDGWTWEEHDYHWEIRKGGVSCLLVCAEPRDSRRGKDGEGRILAALREDEVGMNEERTVFYSDPDRERVAAVLERVKRENRGLLVAVTRDFRERRNPRRRRLCGVQNIHK